MFEILKGLRSMLESCGVVIPGQRVLVIADNEGHSTWLGQLVMNVAASMGAEAVLMIIDPPEMRGSEPPAPVSAAMKSANVSIRVTDKAALVHSTARKEATALGARYCTIDNIPLDHIKKGASPADIKIIAERTEKLAELLDRSRRVRVTTAAGTDITLSIENRKAIPLHPLSPIVAAIPYYAEAASAPVEGTAEGRLVIDLGFIDWGYILSKPICLDIKAGQVAGIVSGSKTDTDKLKSALLKYKNAGNIAEFGIGTSHIVPLPMHGTRQDAARLGTVHFALGRNNDIGGQTLSEVHWDMLIAEATIELDNHCIMKNGELLV
jgi:leucyl aminopeptidase (aminopeptidase T)